ncbi:MAG: photosystem II reaction center X protein [Myxacorys californica WJT36-NPBG1]|jgi:photosystem II PsbX protein|nr:photosystem II reaction center X protein [Myxacorys californica WJT36-NPBG1]
MTPSLMNFLLSLLAGLLIVVVPATVFLVVISQADKVQRGS